MLTVFWEDSAPCHVLKSNLGNDHWYVQKSTVFDIRAFDAIHRQGAL